MPGFRSQRIFMDSLEYCCLLTDAQTFGEFPWYRGGRSGRGPPRGGYSHGSYYGRGYGSAYGGRGRGRGRGRAVPYRNL
uniref:Uncharacterized protein n=1 Tax=Rhizophora mucronata TaxID=61149 RepID=A0A2P2IYI0_RHIMU